MCKARARCMLQIIRASRKHLAYERKTELKAALAFWAVKKKAPPLSNNSASKQDFLRVFLGQPNGKMRVGGACFSFPKILITLLCRRRYPKGVYGDVWAAASEHFGRIREVVVHQMVPATLNAGFLTPWSAAAPQPRLARPSRNWSSKCPAVSITFLRAEAFMSNLR